MRMAVSYTHLDVYKRQGYYAYALIVGNYIDYIIRSNPQEFATIPFVGTLLKNKDYK